MGRSWALPCLSCPPVRPDLLHPTCFPNFTPAADGKSSANLELEAALIGRLEKQERYNGICEAVRDKMTVDDLELFARVSIRRTARRVYPEGPSSLSCCPSLGGEACARPGHGLWPRPLASAVRRSSPPRLQACCQGRFGCGAPGRGAGSDGVQANPLPPGEQGHVSVSLYPCAVLVSPLLSPGFMTHRPDRCSPRALPAPRASSSGIRAAFCTRCG